MIVTMMIIIKTTAGSTIPKIIQVVEELRVDETSLLAGRRVVGKLCSPGFRKDICQYYVY